MLPKLKKPEYNKSKLLLCSNRRELLPKNSRKQSLRQLLPKLSNSDSKMKKNSVLQRKQRRYNKKPVNLSQSLPRRQIRRRNLSSPKFKQGKLVRRKRKRRRRDDAIQSSKFQSHA